MVVIYLPSVFDNSMSFTALNKLLGRKKVGNPRELGNSVEVFSLDRTSWRVNIPKTGTIYVRDVILDVCKMANILPRSVLLFGLALDRDGKQWLKKSRQLSSGWNKKLFLRLRFKIYTYDILSSTDKYAFSYYIKQCRHDLRSGLYKPYLDRKTDNAKYEMLLRMLLLEMTTISLEAKIPLKQVFEKRVYFNVDEIMKRYLRTKQDLSSCRRTLESSLSQFENLTHPDVQLVREVELLNGYQIEELPVKKIFKYKSRLIHEDLDIIIHPQRGISKRSSVEIQYSAAVFVAIATYEDLIEVKIDKEDSDGKLGGISVVICKRNSLPESVCVNSDEEAETLLSWIDGYYQLCHNLYNTLEAGFTHLYRQSMIHAPIERSIAHPILLRSGNKDGNFLVKHHSKNYDGYAIYVICGDSFYNFETIITGDGKVQIYNRNAFFNNIHDLIQHYTHNPIMLEDKIEVVLSSCCDPETCGPVPFYSEKLLSSAVIPQTNRPPKKMNRNLISIDPSELIMKDTLPNGRFGIVNICQGYDEVVQGLKVARQLPQTQIDSNVYKKICECLEGLKNSLIVRLIGVTFFSPIQMMLFEYFELGSLDEYLIENRDGITLRSIFVYSSGIAEALMYLHKTMEYVHGNLRAKNVFMSHDGSIKLSDCCFDWICQKCGVATREDILQRYNWRSPEILLGGMLDEKSDIWSLGVTLWEIMALKLPFDVECSYLITQMESSEFKASNFLRQGSLKGCPNDLYEILESCWAMKPQDRPSADEILEALNSLRRIIPSKIRDEKFYNKTSPLAYNLGAIEGYSDTASEMGPSGYGKVISKRTISEVSLEPVSTLHRALSDGDESSAGHEASGSRKRTRITREERELAGFLARLSTSGSPQSSTSSSFITRIKEDIVDTSTIKDNSPDNQMSDDIKPANQNSEIPNKISIYALSASSPLQSISKEDKNISSPKSIITARRDIPTSKLSLSNMIIKELSERSPHYFNRETLLERERRKLAAERQSLRNAVRKPNPFNIFIHVPNFRFQPDFFILLPTRIGLPRITLAQANVMAEKLEIKFFKITGNIIKPTPVKPSAPNSEPNPYVVAPPQQQQQPVNKQNKVRRKKASPISQQMVDTSAYVQPISNIQPKSEYSSSSGYISSLPSMEESDSLSPIRHNEGKSTGPSPDMSNFISKLSDDIKLRLSRPADLQFKRLLGQGNFGKVFQALWSVTIDGVPQRLHVAAKVLRKDTPHLTESVKDMKLEVQNMATLQNEYIVKLLGISYDEESFFSLITELMPLGSLDKYLSREKQYIDLKSIMNYCWQIAKGMAYLHSRNILHRDLAARNILVKTRDLVKVSDFGLSRTIADADYYKASSDTPLPIKWHAIESILYRRFTKASDTWSYAITVWETYSTWEAEKGMIKKPYEKMIPTEVAEFLENDKRLSKPKCLPDQKWQLICQCWDKHPDNRPSFYLIHLEVEKIMRGMRLI